LIAFITQKTGPVELNWKGHHWPDTTPCELHVEVDAAGDGQAVPAGPKFSSQYWINPSPVQPEQFDP
jgi:hypothetical protein